MKFYTKIFSVLFLTLAFPLFSYASVTSGAIDSANKYAWSENAGWVNFNPTKGNVTVTDSALSGYVWTENYGWINLSPTKSGVKNNGYGTLSGYAWGESLGWIDFGSVTIDSAGHFHGSATNSIIGHINFDCAKCAVATDYRPRSVRPQCNNGLDDDSDGQVDYPADVGCTSLDDNNESDHPSNGAIVIFPPSLPPVSVILPPPAQATTTSKSPVVNFDSEKKINEQKKPPTGVVALLNKIPNIFDLNIQDFFKTRIPQILGLFIPDFLKTKTPNANLTRVDIEKLVPKIAPIAMRGKWNLFPHAVESFVMAPLPREIARLAEKFPQLGETLRKVGVLKVTDIEKLNSVQLNLPGLSESIGLAKANIEPGKFSLPLGVPLARLSMQAKQKLPTEIVFAKSGAGLIDYNIALSIGDKGQTLQKIETIVGKPLQLVVKPDKPVKSIKGYVVFRSKKPRQTVQNSVLNQMAASILFSEPDLTKPQERPVKVDEKLVLLEFEYTDPDGDGIYTANIESPVVDGEYEIITVMDYEDPHLAMRETRLITVVDPEGYVFEKMGNKEVRIPGAVVSLLWLNPETKKYDLWPAKEFQQENSQVTDVRGTYSFLVPVGMYSVRVEAPGYMTYEGKPFEVREGSGVHTNIELKTKYWWMSMVDWKTILLIVVILLLIYNFYKDRLRERLLNKKYE